MAKYLDAVADILAARALARRTSLEALRLLVREVALKMELRGMLTGAQVFESPGKDTILSVVLAYAEELQEVHPLRDQMVDKGDARRLKPIPVRGRLL